MKEPGDMNAEDRLFEYKMLTKMKQDRCIREGEKLFADALEQFELMQKDKTLGSSSRIALLTRCSKLLDKSEQMLRLGGDNSRAVLVSTKRQESNKLRSKLERTTYKLHTAAMQGMHRDIEKCIDKHNIAVNARDKFGQTALHYAAAVRKEISTAKFLVEEFGADVNAADLLGLTPLHLAASTQRFLVCQYLLSVGAQLHEPDKMGSTALHLAASSGSAKCCLVLLNEGADVNSINHRGSTPLHLACRAGRYDASSLLIDQGADLNALDENGCTPEQVATGCAMEIFGLSAPEQRSLLSAFRSAVGMGGGQGGGERDRERREERGHGHAHGAGGHDHSHDDRRKSNLGASLLAQPSRTLVAPVRGFSPRLGAPVTDEPGPAHPLAAPHLYDEAGGVGGIVRGVA